MKLQKDKGHTGKAISRRDFIGTAAAAAAFSVVPRQVLGGPGYTPPSETVNVAGIGVGGQGRTDLRNLKSAGANIVALCDVDQDFAAKTYRDYPEAKVYVDYREMLEKQKDIDAVMIATPDHSHAVIAMAAMKGGKHVYCEKPLTRCVSEARALTEAARKYKVATQMGNWGHADQGIRLICEWIWDGAIGEIREVHAWTNRPVWPQGVELARPKETPPVPEGLNWDLWIGPAPMRPYHPAYLPAIWRGWSDFGTGALGDMACHIWDPIFMALKLGYPTSVEGCCSNYYSGFFRQDFESLKESFPRATVIRFQYPGHQGQPPVKLTWYDGGMMPARPEDLEDSRRMGDGDGGVLFVGDKGKLMCGCYGRSPSLIPTSRHMEYMEYLKEHEPAVKAPPYPGRNGHWVEFVEACKGGAPAGSNFDYAGPLTESVVMGNLSVRFSGRKLLWDGDNMKVTNFEAANKFVHPEYREGWTL